MTNPNIKDFLNVTAGEFFSRGGVDNAINQIQFAICMIGSNPLSHLFAGFF